ncbi:MAG: nucleotidyltransferase domain-containing protein [bacterium]|nr:nucleotidyltransferase domain-containing protein [bacterium]
MKRFGAKKITVTDDLNKLAEKEMAGLPILFAYIFGSAVSGDIHEESDIDIALFLDPNASKQTQFDARLIAHEIIGKIFDVPTEALDISVLNQAPLALRMAVISEGIVLAEKEHGERVKFEMAVLREYDDQKDFLKLYNQSFLNNLTAS